MYLLLMIASIYLIHFVTHGQKQITLNESVCSDWKTIIYTGLLMISLCLLRAPMAMMS